MEPEFKEDRWREPAAQADHAAPLPRLCYAAAHVVMQDDYAGIDHRPEAPGTAEEIAAHVDWSATEGIRARIGATGMGIAEAMDTAQRFSIGWPAARELIERTGAMRLPGGFCAGASTDHLATVDTPHQLITGVCEQIDVIRESGGVPVLLPMPLLTRLGATPDEYVRVYGEIVRNTSDGPIIIHWLGPMFLAELEGYFPDDSFERIMRIDPSRVRGAKLSMLDDALEIRLRREMLERDQIMLTGDDFHFGGLIGGSGEPIRTTEFDGREIPLGEFSHALLGVFDAIATPAALALGLLAAGDRAAYDKIMSRCEALGQAIFETPTQRYKTGLAFLAWLDGRQSNHMLANHEETCRDREHLARIAHLADQAGAFDDPAEAKSRFHSWLDGST